jgi:uncharacterized protein (DUF1015 family)
MAGVRPFRALRYDPERVASFDDVITPPFDVIDETARADLRARSPHNYVRLILPEAEGAGSPYDTARAELDRWLADGVMRQDDVPGYYLLEQEFQGLDGASHRRRGFFAVVKLPEPGEERVVLGHERTFARKINDRIQVTESTQANLGAVFMLYRDDDHTLAPFLGQMDARDPDVQARTIDGVAQRLWKTEPDPVVEAFFANQTLYIADGHHRFATAVEYRDRMRAAGAPDGLHPWDFALIGLVALDDPGLIIWAAHRVFDVDDTARLDAWRDAAAQWFEVTEASRDDLPARVEAGPAGTFGVCTSAGCHVLTLRADREALFEPGTPPEMMQLDVALLHRALIEQCFGKEPGAELVYEPNHARALDRVGSGANQVACLLKAVPPEQVMACADAGVFMPQKATYFFPKLPSGAVVHRLV